VAFPGAPGSIDFVDRCVRRLIALENAQCREDPRYAGEYRNALIVLSLAFEGIPDPVTVAAYRIYGCHPATVKSIQLKEADDFMKSNFDCFRFSSHPIIFTGRHPHTTP